MPTMPRWRGTPVSTHVRITNETRRKLRAVSARRDESCPMMIRIAVLTLCEKYEAGGERNPIRLMGTPGGAVDQKVGINENAFKRLEVLALAESCTISDLLREAIDDFLCRMEPPNDLPTAPLA